MCDTNLKFGPEWLRALTEPPTRSSMIEEKVVYSPILANMKLADYRYGKEEMLALFSSDLEPPTDVLSLGALYVDNCQYPLNLIQMGAEEAKAWQKNNEAGGGRGYNNSATRVSSSASRGRGRGRATSFPYFDRNRFDDPDSDNSNGQPNGGKLNKGEKGWSDTKGKPISDIVGFSDAMKDWRSGKTSGGTAGGGNDKPWPSKQGMVNGHTNMNWRSHERNGNTDDLPNSKNRSAEEWVSLGVASAARKERVNLPEWVTTNSNNIADGGFDDNGKFRPDHLNAVDNVPKWTDDEKWIEEEVEPEMISPQGQHLSSITGKQPHSPLHQKHSAQIKQPSEDSLSLHRLPPNHIDNCPSSSTLVPSPPSVQAPKLRPPGSVHDAGSPPSSSQMQQVSPSLPSSTIQGMPFISSSVQSPSVLPTTSAQQAGALQEPTMDSIRWSYLDPQGQVQGPFRHDEMLEWSTAGYFPNDLLIKRNIDGRFIPLSDMLRIHGRNPFTSGPIPRPINVDANEHINQQQYLQHLLMQQHQQQLLAQQQLMMLHQQNTNLNSILMNSAISQPIIKPDEPLIPGVQDLMERKKEESLNIGQRNHQFDFSPEVSAPSAMDPIKSLLSQLQEGREKKSEEREVSPAHNKFLGSQPLQNDGRMGILPELTTASHKIGYNIEVNLESSKTTSKLHVVQPGTSVNVQLRQQDVQPVSTSMSVREGSAVAEAVIKEDEELSEPVSEKTNDSKETVPLLQEELDPEDIVDFVVPKNNEKKEKVRKKAEIKKKAKSNKDTKPSGPYIPGLPETQGNAPAAVGEATTPSDDKSGSQERDLDGRKFIEDPTGDIYLQDAKESQTRPAPWANCRSPESRELSLHDIQKLEAEKERKKRNSERLVAEAQLKLQKEREAEQRRIEKQAAAMWSQQMTHNNNVKSLAEIQAEEEKNIKHEQQKQHKETKTRKVQAKTSEKATSWAGKIAASIPVQHSSPPVIQSKTRVAVSGDGFWEQPAVITASSPQSAPSTSKSGKSEKKISKNIKKDTKNEIHKNFNDWCKKSLENLNPGPEVDIDTFLGFIQDIESPYEVNDYVKNYIGEGKAHKRFAADYLEKRSQVKNALKNNNTTADDLTSPATALSHDLEFQEAPRKGKKKTRNSKTNLNHLLGFTTAPGSGINRGELDQPM